ncbi:MAG: secretin N-terminal domain-containing protein, partial [Phycisphaerales bacterium]
PSRGDAEEIARLLRRMLEEGAGEVEVISVEELLKRYDAPKPDGKTQGRAVPRTGDFGMPSWPPALPARLAAVVTAAFAQVPPADAAAAGGDTQSGDGVTVAVDKDSNSLLLLGSPREIERALRLVEQAARTLPVEGSRIRAVRLPASSDAAKLASLVNGALARMTPAGGTPGDLAKRVAVVADEETRSLLVVSNDRDFEAVGQLIATVARGQQSEQLVVKSYVLRNAGASRVAEALQSVVAQGAGAKLRSLAVTIVGDGAPDPAAAERAFDPSRLRVVAEKDANAVTVIGSPDAVAFADVVLLAVPYRALPEIGKAHAGALAQKAAVIDACNAAIERLRPAVL